MKFGGMVATKIDDWEIFPFLEELGYDSGWAPDSQMIWSDCYATLALAAHHTSRIRLGTGVSIAGTRLAPVTAHSIASINKLAPGRTFLALGTGHTAMRIMGQNPVKIDEFRDHLRVISGLLRGEEVAYAPPGKAEQLIKFIDRELANHFFSSAPVAQCLTEDIVIADEVSSRARPLAHGSGSLLGLTDNPPILPKINHHGDEGQNQRNPKHDGAESPKRAEMRTKDQKRHGNDLGRGFRFSPRVGRDRDISLQGDQTETGHGKFAADNDGDHPGGRQPELDERDEGGAHEQLVGNRVEHRAGYGYSIGAAGDHPVERVGQRCDQKNNQTPDFLIRKLGQQDHHQEWRHYDAEERQTVRYIPHSSLLPQPTEISVQ
jgi:hypothetical protein